MKRLLSLIIIPLFFFNSNKVSCQSYKWISSTENNYWNEKNINLKSNSSLVPEFFTDAASTSPEFKAWGICFNELGWDALNILPEVQKDKILTDLFAPAGDLRFTMGRFSMNANDYSRDWYSCDEVDGDFELKYFNIDRDKTTLIPYIKAAQKKNPDLTFWISPWSPPSWMKINHSYAVKSDKKYNTISPLSDRALLQGSNEKNDKVFPPQLSVNDYLIQDSRYLKSYAQYFCKFIDAYKTEGIPITKVMYQNEAYSYTIYPGCAWTADGTIRFNVEYLAPALKENHPNVSLYLGTINSNRYEVADKILSDPRMKNTIKGVGFQWEGGQILPAIRKKYPDYTYVQTESECGWGSFNWEAAEHTFKLINHYLGNGCTEYTFWNSILTDDGISGWGWKQNALIRIDSNTKKPTYTPEYYAVKHYTHFVIPGSKLLGYKAADADEKPVLAYQRPDGKKVILVGNMKNISQHFSMKIGAKILEADLPAHSLNTFVGN